EELTGACSAGLHSPPLFRDGAKHTHATVSLIDGRGTSACGRSPVLIFPGGPIRLAAPFASLPAVDDHRPSRGRPSRVASRLRAWPDARCPCGGSLISK